MSGHYCSCDKFMGETYYRISWGYDHYYSGDCKRYPRKISRGTDEVGARRFCKKWSIPFPEKTLWEQMKELKDHTKCRE